MAGRVQIFEAVLLALRQSTTTPHAQAAFSSCAESQPIDMSHLRSSPNGDLISAVACVFSRHREQPQEVVSAAAAGTEDDDLECQIGYVKKCAAG